MINIHTQPNNLQVDEEVWWLIFDTEKNIILGPMQCSGLASSPYTMVVANNSEELDQYIIDNDLIYKNETRINYSIDEL
jgi:hypothetical protein